MTVNVISYWMGNRKVLDGGLETKGGGGSSWGVELVAKE